MTTLHRRAWLAGLASLAVLALGSGRGRADRMTTTDTTDFVTAMIPRSQYGMVLFDASAFDANWSQGDSQFDPTGTPPQRPGPYTDSNTPASRSPEANEERWLDENSTPLMVNRYNGTLIRGE